MSLLAWYPFNKDLKNVLSNNNSSNVDSVLTDSTYGSIFEKSLYLNGQESISLDSEIVDTINSKNNNGFSISCFICFNSNEIKQNLFGSYNNSNDSIYVGIENKKLVLNFGELLINTDFLLENNKWYNIILSAFKTKKYLSKNCFFISLYVNGEKIVDNASTMAFNVNSNFIIGCNNELYAPKCFINDFRFYSHEITYNDAKKIYYQKIISFNNTENQIVSNNLLYKFNDTLDFGNQKLKSFGYGCGGLVNVDENQHAILLKHRCAASTNFTEVAIRASVNGVKKDTVLTFSCKAKLKDDIKDETDYKPVFFLDARHYNSLCKVIKRDKMKLSNEWKNFSLTFTLDGLSCNSKAKIFKKIDLFCVYSYKESGPTVDDNPEILISDFKLVLGYDNNVKNVNNSVFSYSDIRNNKTNFVLDGEYYKLNKINYINGGTISLYLRENGFRDLNMFYDGNLKVGIYNSASKESFFVYNNTSEFKAYKLQDFSHKNDFMHVLITVNENNEITVVSVDGEIIELINVNQHFDPIDEKLCIYSDNECIKNMIIYNHQLTENEHSSYKQHKDSWLQKEKKQD